MNKITLILSIFLVMSFTISAQTVDEFVEMAKAYNPGLKSLRLEYDAALQKIDQVNEWPDPTINLAIGVLPVETRLGAQRLKIGVSQMIPWKGLLGANEDVARAMAEVKAGSDEVREIDIEYAIRTAYSMIQYMDNQKVIIEMRLKVLDALEEIAKSAVRSGKGKLSNVLFTERKREVLEANLMLLEKKKEQPMIMINRWAGRELDTKIQLVQMEEVLLSKNEALQYGQNDHPQFQILNGKIAASQAAIALTEYQTKPKIGVGLDYALVTKRSDADIPGNGRDILMPMASISIPLYTEKYKAKRQEEAILQEAIKNQSKELKDMLTAEVEMAFNTLEYQDQVIEKFQSLKKITKETLKLMRTEYASEGTRFEELLRLEMELIDYDQMIFDAAYEKELALVVILKFR